MSQYTVRTDDAIKLRTALRDSFMVWLDATHAYRSCLTCIHFIEAMETCDKFRQRPPARVIAYGCNEHTLEIPF